MSAFALELLVPESVTARTTPLELEDSLIDIALDGSTALYEAGYELHVCGFGEERWPVDDWDLSAVIQQTPRVVSALREGDAETLEFFEQGLERVVDFEPTGSASVRLRCRSGTSWTPERPTEFRQLAEVRTMFEVFAQRVYDALLAMDRKFDELDTAKDWPRL